MAARGGKFTLVIDGIDSLEASFDSIVVEGASTSFQFHLQVEPDEAGPLYNLAQLITAPLLALSANSPVLLNRRVWHETRVALFERTIEYRSTAQLARSVPTRVGFGEAWVEDSIVEVFRENAMRHHVIMVRDPLEDPFEALREGRVPELGALALHNGTVWRWNRPCYGITDGKPHLRIENRALPAGPTVVDQVANAALFYGLMAALEDEAARIPQRLAFEEARENLFAAAQHGLAARFTWLDGERIGARKLLRKQLIPRAREGLEALRATRTDIDHYLGIVAARADNGRTGARWLLDSLANVPARSREAVCREAVEIVHAHQGGEEPVHRWNLIAPAPDGQRLNGITRVADIMTKNLFTARPEDLVDLATSMMEWRHVRHVPVESISGELVGLLSTRELLRLRGAGDENGGQPIPVGDIMQTDPPTISPDAPLEEAFAQILEDESGCLLVVANRQLVGIVTERDLLEAAVELIP
jgi:CBS domain-containing protein